MSALNHITTITTAQNNSYGYNLGETAKFYLEVTNSKRQKEGKFGQAVYKFTFTVCLRGHCTFVVVLVTRVPSKHLHLLRPGRAFHNFKES